VNVGILSQARKHFTVRAGFSAAPVGATRRSIAEFQDFQSSTLSGPNQLAPPHSGSSRWMVHRERHSAERSTNEMVVPGLTAEFDIC